MEAAVIIDASRDPIASRRSDDLIKEAQDANNQSHAFLPWMSCSRSAAFTAFTRNTIISLLQETCDEGPLSGRVLALRTLNPETSLARPSPTNVWEPHHDAATASRRSPALKWHNALFPAHAEANRCVKFGISNSGPHLAQALLSKC